jgi:hypothetical protein
VWTTADNYVAHWQLKQGLIDIAGTVDGTGCGDFKYTCAPGSCAYPRLSAADDCLLHQDRDFEFHFMPSNGLAAVTEANMHGGATSGEGDIGVEWEWMYFYPRSQSNQWDGVFLSPGYNPGGGVPWHGDQIAMRGMHVIDCGEQTTYNTIDNARSEIHPPVAVVWSHPNEYAGHRATVNLRAASHTTPPRPGRAFGGTFSATFDVPGGGLLGKSVYVGPIQTDWLALGETDSAPGYYIVIDNGCSLIGDKQHPFAHIGGAYTLEPVSSYFDIRATRLNDYQVNVQITVLRDNLPPGFSTPIDSNLFPVRPPNLVAAHFDFCIPECTAGRQLLNGCEGGCQPVFGALEAAQKNMTSGNVFSSVDGEILRVAGWAVDPLPGGTSYIQRLDVYAPWGLLGSLNGPSLHRPRQDVVDQYQQSYPGNDFLYSGFDGTVPFGNHPIGSYTIQVQAIDANGYPFQIGWGATVRVQCDGTNCSGCCDTGRNVCSPGTSNVACGSSSNICRDCTSLGQYACSNATCLPCTPTFACGVGDCGGNHADGCGNTISCGACFDCSACPCGCNSTGTGCGGQVRCPAAACAKAGGTCDPCAGCVF